MDVPPAPAAPEAASGVGAGRRPPRSPRLLTVREGGSYLGWSLLAANGRPLGREAARYQSEAELSHALRELMADRLALRYVVARGDGRDWRWHAYLPGRRSYDRAGSAIARSTRGYLRQDQCRRGAAGFATALGQLSAEHRGRHPW